MKAKYLFYSLALASAFTACTQDELFDAPALESNDVAGRPVAGVVTFVGDEVESRYNSEAATFETGDQMGLYLMDEFRGYGELPNANDTYWTWQSCWWNMYDMVDYISTNYGYVYNAETGEWINRASQLVEGNYIAMFPQNTRATNRRDLWHPIKANVDLVDHSTKARYYVNRDNQFFVGYEQVLRDQKPGKETGELTANISMKPILTYAKMYFENQAANDFKIKKVVFKAKGGATLPNVAYVKPANIVSTDNEGCVGPFWAWGNHAELKKQLKDDCGNLLAWSKYDRATYNHTAARALVQYESTADGRIPYGMTDAEAVPVYEYVFNFPADADLLKGHDGSNSSTERVCGISIALPAFEGWQTMEVVVYGEMWDPTANDMTGAWRPGIIKKLTSVDNAEFKLDKLKLWEQGYDIPAVTARIDDNYFYQQTEVRVSTTKDLYDLINARLTSASTTENILFEVQHYGNGLAITEEVVDLIKNYEKKNNVDVVVTFNNRDGVSTPIILEAENCIDMFEYVGVNVVVEAPQTITDVTVDGINELRNFSTINVVKGLLPTTLDANQIINEVGAVIEVKNATIIANIHNEGTVDLNTASINGEIVNEAILTTAGDNVITSIINDNNCINCGNDKAQLTVKSGVLTITSYLDNKDNVTVEAGAKLVSMFLNYGTIEVKGNVSVQGNSENAGTINVAATGEARVEAPNALANTGTINVEGELVENIQNSGLINVKGDGHVIVNGKIEGKVNGIIDVTEANDDNTAHAAKDKTLDNYFRYTVGTENRGSTLQAALKARISSQNWSLTGNPIILVWGANSATSFYGNMTEANVERIIIENDLVITKTASTTITKFGELNDLNWTASTNELAVPSKKALWVKKGATLTVENGAKLILAERTTEQDGGDNLYVCVDGKFMAKNHSFVEDDKVLVEGAGTVEIDTNVSNFLWNAASTWTGNWDGE